MSAYFLRLDEMMKTQKMPDEFLNVRAQILCNDCEQKSVTAFHFVYHKCQVALCGSYNTKLLRTFTDDSLNTSLGPTQGNSDIEELIQSAQNNNMTASLSSSSSESSSQLSISNRIDNFNFGIN